MSLRETPPRTYRVEFHRDLHPGPSGYGTTGLDWRLYTYGRGHWCVGSGHSGTFRSEEEAEEAGRIWVFTGRAPLEQTDDMRMRDRAQQADAGRPIRKARKAA